MDEDVWSNIYSLLTIIKRLQIMMSMPVVPLHKKSRQQKIFARQKKNLNFAFDILLMSNQTISTHTDLSAFKSRFHIPFNSKGEYRYFCGNSLGLQVKSTRNFVLQELDDWAHHGVLGHEQAKYPWVHYHEFLTDRMADVVGALSSEVVVMNTLTVNLHLMMVSFYRPTKKRYKIIMEASAFPSDRYAVESQIRFHGFDPADALLILKPSPGETIISDQEIAHFIKVNGEETALILIGSVNYYSGQAYPLADIVRWGQAQGSMVGFDLAHGAGNLRLRLHDDGPDFAVWCSYKYLNSGPGSLASCFVHSRHHGQFDIPRFAGWWGHDKATRFKMSDQLQLMPGAEGWQLSNPPILPMACMMASLEVFAEAGMDQLRKRSLELSNYFLHRINGIAHPAIQIITPQENERKGCQISLRIKNADKSLYNEISAKNIIADWREPDVIRVAPVPLYNDESDIDAFCDVLRESLLYEGKSS